MMLLDCDLYLDLGSLAHLQTCDPLAVVVVLTCALLIAAVLMRLHAKHVHEAQTDMVGYRGLGAQ